MQGLDFNQLFEDAALDLYDSYQKSGSFFTFLQERLPAKYGLEKGYLVNKRKEVATSDFLFYDRLNCPKLISRHPSPHCLFPANYVFGNLTYFNELNQSTLEATLEKDALFCKVFDPQIKDKQQAILPLSIWIAKDLAAFISLNDLEDRLLAEANPPDLVAIFNRGLLVKLNKHTIQSIYALAQKDNHQSFDKEITANLISITEKTSHQQFFKIGADLPYKNCFFSYILLLELVKHQATFLDDLSAELVAIW